MMEMDIFQGMAVSAFGTAMLTNIIEKVGKKPKGVM